MKNLTKLEIVNETVSFYNGDVKRRSKTDTNCLYNGINGEHCAIGRCMLAEFTKQGVKLEGNHLGIETLFSRNKKGSLDEMLQVQYRGHEVEFWLDLQHLHDTDAFWDNAGLNAKGEERINSL